MSISRYAKREATYKGWHIIGPDGDEIAHVVFEYEANRLLDLLNQIPRGEEVDDNEGRVAAP